ncbi:MAG: DUF72 domain-containing protein, partial [Acidimicrobiia bacterium]
GWRFAMEFRHPSFHCDEARAQLAAAGVALCVADTEDPGDNAGRPDLVCTADFAYLRLRRGGYDEAALGSWGEAIGAVLAGGTDVFAFFKHEDSATGPRHAAVLMGASSSPGATSRPARPRP